MTDPIENQFMQAALKQSKFIKDCDSKRANREFRKLSDLRVKLAALPDRGAMAYKRIFSTTVDPEIQLVATSFALAADEDWALPLLEQLAANDRAGLTSISAEMTLKEWRNGNIKKYWKEQEALAFSTRTELSEATKGLCQPVVLNQDSLPAVKESRGSSEIEHIEQQGLGPSENLESGVEKMFLRTALRKPSFLDQGDSKSANRELDKIEKLQEVLAKSSDLGAAAYKRIYEATDDLEVRILVAQCALLSDPRWAIKALKRLASNQQSGLIAAEAEMILRRAGTR